MSRYLIIMVAAVLCTNVMAQPLRIGFWNLENLYTAASESKFEGSRQVIEELGADILGLSELESREAALRIIGPEYDLIHYDSPDSRGMDLALVFRKATVKITSSEPIAAAGTGAPTRDLLKVKALLLEDSTIITIFVAHLPSRRGNNPVQSRRREAIMAQIDSLASINPMTIIIGDFNQNPNHWAQHYNAALKPYLSGKGSYAYRDRWLMYDQIVVSYDLKSRLYGDQQIFRNRTMIQSAGRFSGYPNRGKPSDHLPIYIELKKII